MSKIRKYELEGLCGHDEFPSPAAQFRNIQNQNKGKPLDLSGLSAHYQIPLLHELGMPGRTTLWPAVFFNNVEKEGGGKAMFIKHKFSA